MRIFLGTAEIAGYYARLRAGLDELGVESTQVQLVSHRFEYGDSSAGGMLFGAIEWTAARRGGALERGRAARAFWRLAQAPLRLPLLAWALARCDVFVLAFGTSVAGRWELPLMRLLGKRVVHLFHGSDTRPPYLDGFIAQGGAGPRRMRRLTRRTVQRLRWIERWTDVIVAHPASAQIHVRPFVGVHHVGIPIQSVAMPERPPREERSGPVRLLHSPSNPGVKGSDRIRAAVAAVAKRGHALELLEITGRPNAEVREALLNCDLVVDQAYSDSPMPGFGTEAAVEGVAVIVGSYAADDPGAPLPAHVPATWVRPDQLADEIERLVVDSAARIEIGERARRFVLEQWSPRAVAERILRLATGDVPAEWMVDPQVVTYPYGCGLAAEDVSRIVAALVERFGPEALRVDDKPLLLERLLAVARADRR